MSFEISRRFQGEVIECDVIQWFPRFEKKNDVIKGGGVHQKVLHRAPEQTTILGVGIEGQWKVQSFLIDPKLSACRVGGSWFMISDIDAASQFAVEKDNPVAFPHEKKPIYVSGHVGLHLHLESTNETFTLVFPGHELADVSFDAFNRLSYDQLSLEIFEEHEDEAADENKKPGGGSSSSSSKDKGKASKHGRHGSSSADKEIAKIAKKAKPGAAAAAAVDDEDDFNDNEFYVASSGPELINRGRVLNVNDFTSYFLEGGGMGSLNEQGQTATGGGAPSGGIIRLRKDTGSLSTWIARMEEGDEENVYLMKLSKALIKAPLNKIIRASPPSIAKHFGPVVGLNFAHLLIRSETFQAQFILEETYTAPNGDRRIHRLICVFSSLEERVRWEDWFMSHGVKKKAIDPTSVQKKGEDGADLGGSPASPSSRAMKRDATMRLIEECFVHDDIWERPHQLPSSDEDEDEEYDGGEDAYREDGYNFMVQDDGTLDPFVGDSPRAMSPMTTPRGGEFTYSSAFSQELTSPASASLKSPRSIGGDGDDDTLLSPLSQKSGGGGGKLRKSKSRSLKREQSEANPSSPMQVATTVQKKTEEEERAEQEAAQRCPWFAGYEKPKKSKWEEISEAVKKEQSAGSQIFEAARVLKSASMDNNSNAAAVGDFGGEDAIAHIPGAPVSPKKSKFTALMRAAQVEKAKEALERMNDPNYNPQHDSQSPSPTSPNNNNAGEQSSAYLTDLEAAEAEASRALGEEEAAGGNQYTNMILPGRGKLTTQKHADPSKGGGASPLPLGGGPRSSPSALERFAAAQEKFVSLQDQQQQKKRDGGTMTVPPSVTSKFDQQEQQIDPHPGSSMFGKPTLFGESLPPKFPPINLRSEGYVGQVEIKQQVAKEGRGGPVITGTESNVITSSPPGSPISPSNNTMRRKYPGSPAADEARDFSFSFKGSGGAGSGGGGATPSGGGGGLFGGEHQQWSSALRGGEQEKHDQAAASSSMSPPSSQRKLVETSSDSDDESSRRFANARAMRAVSQLGEEFVGPGFSPSRKIGASTISSLSGHIAPTCPLCGADRSQVAICKKSGRLHATYVPRYAAGRN